MNGLEALDKIKKQENVAGCDICDRKQLIGCNCYRKQLAKSKEIESIERELKVNQILKEKKVDLYYISPGSQTTIEEKLEAYNFSHKLLPLTLEEMTLIVEWLKGE